MFKYIIGERGKLLTLFLIWTSVGTFFSAVGFLIPNVRDELFGLVPLYVVALFTTQLLFSICILVGLWGSKRWAVYAYFVAFGIGELLSMTVYKSLLAHDANIGFTLLHELLFLWSIKRKFYLFH